MKVAIHAEYDAFTVQFDSDLTSDFAIKQCIRIIGYDPVEIDPTDLAKERGGTSSKDTLDKSTLPETIAHAVRECERTGKLLLIDFYAAWCAPCVKLDKDMNRPGLRESVGNFIVVKVDTDESPSIAKYFDVKALPTLVVLDGSARERFKQVGIIDPAQLKRVLDDLAARKGTD